MLDFYHSGRRRVCAEAGKPLLYEVSTPLYCNFNWFDRIYRKRSGIEDGKYGQKILKIVESMYKSAETRKVEEVVY